MPYSSKMVEATRPKMPRPLIPEDAKPEACRRLRCTMEIFREGVMRDENGEVTFSLIDLDKVAFGHTSGGRTDTFLIPLAWFDDVDKDIWAELRPWMAGLHEPPEE